MSAPSPASPWWEACLHDDGTTLDMRLTKQGAALVDLLARGLSYAEATALVKIKDGADDGAEEV